MTKMSDPTVTFCYGSTESMFGPDPDVPCYVDPVYSTLLD